MKLLRIATAVLLATAVALAGVVLAAGKPADPPPAAAKPTPLVVHEWGTFTSFSGSDGVPSTFHPNYTDLPEFVYSQAGPNYGKGTLLRDGTVSMETPVIYFYTQQPMKVSVKVGFPKGWITEWYPHAAKAPSPEQSRSPGQSMEWNVRLLAGEDVKLPGQYRDERDHYFFARETDAVPLQAEVLPKDGGRDLRGGAVVQREKFLFYRGVGTFAPPVKLKALGNGEVKVSANADCSIDGLVLVNVRGGRIGFKVLGNLAAGSEIKATIPDPTESTSGLAAAVKKELVTAGLFEREATAMVNTWDSAWFGEEGTRLLYLVPRSRTDELLPLTITPKPDALVRVLVGRHDFLTPEQEATADKAMKRLKAAQAEMTAAETELRKIGRFEFQAREQSERRLGNVTRR
jgi:hypothetical protein